jgi:histidyl-tRNA synthetase
MEYIKPELASGFKDYLPEDMIPRQKMLDTIRATFERFGFLPLDTPVMEKEEILTGGDPNFNKNIYRAGIQGGSDKLALRFDLTVPLARVVASNTGTLKRPFKRYQIGKVARGEKPQAGRFREFTQFDADIVGSSSMLADAEIVSLMYETLLALEIPAFTIKLNNRKILNGLSEYAGYSQDKNDQVLRVIDKLDKQGWEAVQTELFEVGLEKDQIFKIKDFIELRGSNPDDTLEKLRELLSNSKVAQQGILELSEVVKNLKSLGVPEYAWMVDSSVARGLGYYTGTVFETTLNEFPDIGSVFSGGRYDDLVQRFGPTTVPAVGASVGIDRLFAALEKLEIITRQKNIAKVLVLNFDSNCQDKTQEASTQLRRENIPTELYLGSEDTLKGQLAYAVKEEYRIAIIIGSNEKEKGTVVVKDMDAREQKELPMSELSNEVKRILK